MARWKVADRTTTATPLPGLQPPRRLRRQMPEPGAQRLTYGMVMRDLCDCGTTGCDPCVCGHPWSEHTDPRYEFGTGCLDVSGCPCAEFDPLFKAHVVMPPGLT
jgi:hypothetical protein